MDPRSNTWLMSWDLEVLMGMAGAQFSDSDLRGKLGCGAFGPNGRELNILTESGGLIRIFESPVSEPEAATPSNPKIGVSFQAPLPHGTSDKPEEVVVRND